MKKWIVLLLTLAMLLSLAACGGDPSDQDHGNNGTTQGGVDIGSLISGLDNLNGALANADSAYKAEIIRQAEAEGVSVSFGNDGSTTLTDEEGNKYIQKADGTWIYEGKNGEQVDIGSGKWPDNAFTKILPKPSMAITATTVDSSEFAVIFAEGVTKDAVKAYAEQLKNKGFTIEPEINDQTLGAMEMYSYSASNSAGYRAELAFLSGTATLSVTK